MSIRVSRTFIFVALIAVTTVVPGLAEFYTDWLWFKEVGFEQVFLRSLTARSTVTAVTWFVVFLVLWANLIVVFRSLRPRHFTISTAAGPQVISMDPGRYRPLVMLAAAAAALAVGLYAGSRWQTWLYFLYSTPFGKTDPILGRDIGFYVFTLPVLEMVNGTILVTLVLAAAVTVAATCSPATSGSIRAAARTPRNRRCGIWRRSAPRCSSRWPSAPGCRFPSC